MSAGVDLMTGKWLLYEQRLRDLFIPMNLSPVKLNFVLLSARDAYLRCAPSLIELPDCPPAIHQYVCSLTLGLLGQIARQAGANYEMSTAAAQAYGAVLIAESGPLEASPLNPKESS